MSLNRKLWFAIAYILILASGGSFILTALFTKYYLEDQLQVKNIDNATSLALSMSHLQKDSATLDLLISAQFDAGHYQYIGLYDPSGKLLIERVNTLSKTKAPALFIKLFPIEVQAGTAEVQDGWKQYGTLKLESNLSFAYDKLWELILLIAAWSGAIGLASCYAGNQSLQRVLRPLKDIVNQAEAIGERRFITIKEPKTTEFKAVVAAMNSLSNRIKSTVDAESARLEELQYKANFDYISGLMNQQYFRTVIDASIGREDYFSQGALVVARLTNLALIDQTLGYQQTNALLKQIGNTLENACLNQPSLIAGRLSGSDFAIFSKAPIDAYVLGNQIKSLLEQTYNLDQANLNSHFITATTPVTKQDSSLDLITLVDGVLNQISVNDENILHVINQDDLANYVDVGRSEWERLLNSALDNKRLKLEHYPVVNQKGELIHRESPVRLQLVENEKWFCAGEFITWAMQLNLMKRIDELVLENAINLLANGAQPIGLNISANTICDKSFVKKALALIKAHPSVAHHLYLEIPEQGAFDHFAEFKAFCSALKGLGCNIGIEQLRLSSARKHWPNPCPAILKQRSLLAWCETARYASP